MFKLLAVVLIVFVVPSIVKFPIGKLGVRISKSVILAEPFTSNGC